MQNINVTNFRKNIFELLDGTIKYNEVINISTKSGNAIVMSEEDYMGLMETLYLNSIPGMKEKIEDGLKVEVEDTIREEDVDW